MTNGRQKGSRAEREVAGLVEGWWAAYEPGVRFVRTPLSGGWGAPAVRAEFKTSGDLMTTSRVFPFTIEVKKREAWCWETLAKGKPSPVWEWWRQAQTQALELQLVPLLWFTRNRRPWWVMLPHARAAMWKLPMRIVWTRDALHGVHVGDLHPAVVDASAILGSEPTRFLTATRRGRSAAAP